jgi:hypothetical protein
LDLFSNQSHACFHGLNKIKDFHPETILLNSIYASERENCEIEDSARNLAQLNKFEKVLNESSLFRVIKCENQNNQDNFSNFSPFFEL